MTTLTLKQAEDQALESNIAIHFTQQDVSQHNYQQLHLTPLLPDNA